MADYAQAQFRAAGIEAKRNETALTVVFPRPPEWVCEKWQLARAGDISHLIAMPHTTKEQIDDLLADILTSQTKENGAQA